MTSENHVVEASISGEDETVVLSDGNPVSMQVLQNIYNEITGKKESLEKTFTHDHRVTIEDLKQLHHKIIQSQEPFHIIEHNESITVFHINDNKEVFSSFDRFCLYDSSITSPVENVRFEYNFLIKMPIVEKIQSYSIKIDVISREGMKERFKNEESLQNRVFPLVATRTSHIKIEYIDYRTAKIFQSVFEEWIKSLDTTKRNNFFGFIQKNSDYIPFVFRIITAFFIAFFTIYNIEVWFDKSDETLSSLIIGISAFTLIYGISSIAWRIGRSVEMALDQIQPISYVIINRGDEKVVHNANKKKNISVTKILFSPAFIVVLNLLSAWIALNIGIK